MMAVSVTAAAAMTFLIIVVAVALMAFIVAVTFAIAVMTAAAALVLILTLEHFFEASQEQLADLLEFIVIVNRSKHFLAVNKIRLKDYQLTVIGNKVVGIFKVGDHSVVLVIIKLHNIKKLEGMLNAFFIKEGIELGSIVEFFHVNSPYLK